ncbi:unnamed protein product [Mytilus coruscus]|uniref:Chitin-binding type-2 domain-containing protein n=1 Tax=Mytilus coruscus TaxID=42192 RepID=A0A6J8DA78_MYTCO|nr:unnamed protein product [Mytilus coruscus]
MASTGVYPAKNLNGSGSSIESSPYAVFEEVQRKDQAEEENEATSRNNLHTNNRNEEGGRINHGFANSVPLQEEDRLNSAEEENEATNRNTLHTNNWNKEKGQINHGFTDIPVDSLDSIYTATDITSNEFMMRPDIHVLKDKNDLPKFTTPMDEWQFQPHKNENFTEATDGINMIDNNEDRSYIANSELFENSRRNSVYSDLENHRKRNKNCLLRILILMFIVGCISGTVAWIIHNKYFLGSKDPPTIIIDPPIFPDKCENDISTATVGEQMCIPYTQKFTGSPSGIHVKQLSSQYLSALHGFSVNVSSDTFEQQNGGWIINYNSSRTDQQIRFMMGKAKCDSIGIYKITIEYGDGNVTSSEFEIKLKDPQLQQSVTRINDSIHVHCEMIKTCMASSLALFVNDEGSSRMIPDINVCSNNDKESGTTVSVDAIIPASWLSGNMTISCVPLMTDPKLAANLTSTTGIPVCEGDCVPDCKDDPQGEAYFPDKNVCTNFYQCSNGKLVSQTCSLSTYWSTSECTCVHFDDEICHRDTNRFFKPLLSIEKCTNASLV